MTSLAEKYGLERYNEQEEQSLAQKYNLERYEEEKKDFMLPGQEFAAGAGKSILQTPINAAQFVADMLTRGRSQLPEEIKQMQGLSLGDLLEKFAQADLELPDPYNSTQYKVGEIGGEIGSYLAGGNLVNKAMQKSAKLGSKGAEFLQGEGLGGLLRRTSGAGLTGAIESKGNREEGAATGAGISLAFEALPAGVKTIGKIAETIYPVKKTAKLAQDLKNSYDSFKAKTEELFAPAIKKYGKYLIDNNLLPQEKIFTNQAIDPKILENPRLKTLYEEFKKYPTVATAHMLQSDLGKAANKILSNRKSSFSDESIGLKLKDLQNSLLDQIQLSLGKRSPEAAQSYKNAREFYKENVGPFNESGYIYSVVNGAKEEINPKTLRKELLKTVEKRNEQKMIIDPAHAIKTSLNDLTKSLNRGKLAKVILGFSGGGVAGGPIGAMVGGSISPFASGIDTLSSLAQNKEFVNFINKLNTLYGAGKTGVVLSQAKEKEKQ